MSILGSGFLPSFRFLDSGFLLDIRDSGFPPANPFSLKTATDVLDSGFPLTYVTPIPPFCSTEDHFG